MSKPIDTYTKPPMAFTKNDIDQYVSEQKFGFVDTIKHPIWSHYPRWTPSSFQNHWCPPLQPYRGCNGVGWQKWFFEEGEPKGVHLQKLIGLVNSCGVTFSIWEKRDADRKGSGRMDWTSLMGDWKKKTIETTSIQIERLPWGSGNTASHSTNCYQVMEGKVLLFTVNWIWERMILWDRCMGSIYTKHYITDEKNYQVLASC